MKACLAWVLAGSLAFPGAVAAKKKDRDGSKDERRRVEVVVEKERKSWSKVVITPVERRVVRDWVVEWREKEEGRHGKLPPGLAKKLARGKSLPPGWQKKLVPGEVMPVVVFERARPLSEVILIPMPPPPQGTTLVVLDGRMIRLADATRTILDVFNLDQF